MLHSITSQMTLLFMVTNMRTSIPIQFDTPFLSHFLYTDLETGHSQYPTNWYMQLTDSLKRECVQYCTRLHYIQIRLTFEAFTNVSVVVYENSCKYIYRVIFTEIRISLKINSTCN